VMTVIDIWYHNFIKVKIAISQLLLVRSFLDESLFNVLAGLEFIFGM